MPTRIYLLLSFIRADGAQATKWDTPSQKFQPFDLEVIVQSFQMSELMSPNFAVALFVPMAELPAFIEKAKEIAPASEPQVVYHTFDDVARPLNPGTARLDAEIVQPELIFNAGPLRTFFDTEGEDKLRGTGEYTIRMPLFPCNTACIHTCHQV